MSNGLHAFQSDYGNQILARARALELRRRGEALIAEANEILRRADEYDHYCRETFNEALDRMKALRGPQSTAPMLEAQAAECEGRGA